MSWLYSLLAAIGIPLLMIPVLMVFEPGSDDNPYHPAPGD